MTWPHISFRQHVEGCGVEGRLGADGNEGDVLGQERRLGHRGARGVAQVVGESLPADVGADGGEEKIRHVAEGCEGVHGCVCCGGLE